MKLSEKIVYVIGEVNSVVRTTAVVRLHNTCCACVDQLMGAYSKLTLLADVFINQFCKNL